MAEKKRKNIFSAIKTLKHKEIFIAVIAVMLMLLIYFSGDMFSDKTANSNEVTNDANHMMQLQKDISKAVAKMSGDKNSEVVIGWDASQEDVIANTISQNGNTQTITPTIIQTSNGAKPVILKQIYPKAIGAIVVCKGAEDTRLRIEIIKMVSTLLGISPEKVEVYKAK